jgi:quinol monooxygenase YgiN
MTTKYVLLYESADDVLTKAPAHFEAHSARGQEFWGKERAARTSRPSRVLVGSVIIVAGALIVDPGGRDAYLEGCRGVVEAARRVDGCLDYALSPDLLEPGRINVYELWASEEDLHEFRGSGPDGDQMIALLDIRVEEYEVVARAA